MKNFLIRTPIVVLLIWGSIQGTSASSHVYTSNPSDASYKVEEKFSVKLQTSDKIRRVEVSDDRIRLQNFLNKDRSDDVALPRNSFVVEILLEECGKRWKKAELAAWEKVIRKKKTGLGAYVYETERVESPGFQKAIFFSKKNSKFAAYFEDAGNNKKQIYKILRRIKVLNNLCQYGMLNLATDVDWKVYEDKDVSFVYPKTFLGTSLQEVADQNLSRTQWEALRQDNTIYIRPNFESPAAEFGSTYEINIFKTLEEAKKFSQSITWDMGSSKNICGPISGVELKSYTVCMYERETDEGLGRAGRYYAIIPQPKNGTQTPPWIYIFDGSGGIYSNYLKTILIPSIKAK